MASIETDEVVGATLAHAAAFTGDTGALLALAKEDPTLLRARTEDGETPAHHAAAAGIIASLECLGEIDATLLAEADVEGWCVRICPVHRLMIDLHAHVRRGTKLGTRAYMCVGTLMAQDACPHGHLLWPATGLAGMPSNRAKEKCSFSFCRKNCFRLWHV